MTPELRFVPRSTDEEINVEVRGARRHLLNLIRRFDRAGQHDEACALRRVERAMAFLAIDCGLNQTSPHGIDTTSAATLRRTLAGV